jgi:hypothetical protein
MNVRIRSARYGNQPMLRDRVSSSGLRAIHQSIQLPVHAHHQTDMLGVMAGNAYMDVDAQYIELPANKPFGSKKFNTLSSASSRTWLQRRPRSRAHARSFGLAQAIPPAFHRFPDQPRDDLAGRRELALLGQGQRHVASAVGVDDAGRLQAT